MQILLDECLPKKLKRELIGHTVFTVQEKGWSGVKNGELLRRAEKEFDVWVTADQNIEFQHNLSHFNIAIVVLVAPLNKLEALLPLIPELHEVLKTIQFGQIAYIYRILVMLLFTIAESFCIQLNLRLLPTVNTRLLG